MNTTSAQRRITQAGPLVIAHRGFSQQAPENTLPAFRLALAARADLVELDYHQSADGRSIVLHDHTLDRTTDVIARRGGTNHAVRTFPAADLATLDAGSWFGSSFAGTRVPTLTEALAVIQPTSCTLIERKSGDPEGLIEILKKEGWLDQVVVQSFDWTFVKAAHASAPDLVLGALGPPSSQNGRSLKPDEKVLSAQFLAAIKALGARVAVWNRQVTAEAVDLAHRQGLRVWVYTIDDPEEAANLVKLGVDGIISNNPTLIRNRLQRPRSQTPTPESRRTVPRPLADHPGNVFLQDEPVAIPLPDALPATARTWRLLDDRLQVIHTGTLPALRASHSARLELPKLGPGWYRVEFDAPNQTNHLWTTMAILRPLQTPTPASSPICVDSAAAWFAKNHPDQQMRFANLAALAGISWVRDRLRWSELQPEAGPLIANPTTYDSSAEIQLAAGLNVLQVFHDTPAWTHSDPKRQGQFAPDLRMIYRFSRELARRFQGRVAAWEPWNEANVATFGAHTVDQMCAWQKAAWLGFKAADPNLIVGWNATAAVPTPSQTYGVLANETWPYFDTYNIHTYDWAHAYATLWGPAREAACGKPLWITEADRGTPHLKNPPWFDQDPRLERLKAEWIPQAFANSLFAGAQRHFHFILGNYQEPNGIQFGLLRHDLTPRPAYVALATVGRCLAGAQILGRWQPAPHVHLYAFHALPDGLPRDVLVLWTEKDADWDSRGTTTSDWSWPAQLQVLGVVDYLGRPLPAQCPKPLTSAPIFVFLAPGQATTLPLESPPPASRYRPGQPSPIVLQLAATDLSTARVEDLPWSEGYAYCVAPGQAKPLTIHLYNFDDAHCQGALQVVDTPPGWNLSLASPRFQVDPMDRTTLTASLQVPTGTHRPDGWIQLRADCGPRGQPVLASRFLVR